MDKKFSIFQYNKHSMEFAQFDDIGELLARVDPTLVNWITVSDVTLQADHTAIKQVLAHFELQPLLLNTIFEYEQAQFEGEYDDCLYMEYAVLLYSPDRETYTRAPGSIILGSYFLILLEKKRAGLFERTRERIIRRHTLAQRYGADYLLYLLVKTMVINYQTIIKELAFKFEDLEDEVIGHPGAKGIYDKILALREQVKPVYGHVRQLGDFVDTVRDEETRYITRATRRYFTGTLSRETEVLLEGYRHYRQWVSELMDLHRSAVNENTNQVMKTLTIIATIFLPLSFVVGVYGMNFDRMPELHWPYGYPAVLMLLVVIGLGILYYMRRKKWLE